MGDSIESRISSVPKRIPKHQSIENSCRIGKHLDGPFLAITMA